MKKICIIIFLLLSIEHYCEGKIKLPAILSSHMVLQQQTNVELWGWGDVGKTITIKPSWNNKSYETSVLSDGTWSIDITTIEAGGPYTIIFNDGETIELTDVYLGEVWLCSGQSNMEMPVKGYLGQPVLNSTATIANADSELPVRLFTVEKKPSKDMLEDCNGKWRLNNSESVAEFSATAYFFGLQLYKSLKVPIGLVHSSWGGSVIQAWMPAKTLHNFPEISQTHLTESSEIKKPNSVASMLYNGMIHPIKNMTFRGVIWYQGESNRYNPEQYERLFPIFVKAWRSVFRNTNLPFCYAQIAPYSYKNSNAITGALIREVQYKCEKLIPNVAMAVLMDSGNETCIHPANKKIAGQRLAYLALHHVYDQKAIPANSPRFSSKQSEGKKLILSFDNAPDGITSYGKPLELFEIAGADNVFYPAKARIINRSKVEVWSPEVEEPQEVRYAFKNFTTGDLFGVNGLPVSSFRTDSLDLSRESK